MRQELQLGKGWVGTQLARRHNLLRGKATDPLLWRSYGRATEPGEPCQAAPIGGEHITAPFRNYFLGKDCSPLWMLTTHSCLVVSFLN